MTSSEIRREAECVTMTEIRDAAPAHYVLKIKSFSLFAKKNIEKYESSEFEVGGSKWKLILYPNGDKSRNGEDHISIYLAVSGTNPFQLGEAIYVAVRFSLYDQICDRYLIEQGRVVRLHALKVEYGVPRFMPLKIFADPSNGYLVDDACVFGAEVFVIKSSEVGECVTLSESTSHTLEWKISGLSTLRIDAFYDEFTVGDHNWKVSLYAKGNSANERQNLSVYLSLLDADKLASGQKVKARVVIRVKGQNNVVRYQPEAQTTWFSSSFTIRGIYGWRSFMSLNTVQDHLTDDSCVIEAEFTVLGTVSKLP